MAFRNYFDELWALDWGVGIFYNSTQFFDSFFLVTGDIPHEYFNFWSPKVDIPEKVNLEQIDSEFTKITRQPAVYLTEVQQHAGFVEYLIRHGYSYEDSECWLGYDQNTYTKKNIDHPITEINEENWSQFSEPALVNFPSFPTQPKYLEFCLQVLQGKKAHSGVDAKFYAILESEKSVASAGLFCSVKDNFAYLHCGSTNEGHRGKGYQTALIVKRINHALEQGIDRIYTITERGGQSWTNFIRLGFNELQQPLLLKKKS